MVWRLLDTGPGRAVYNMALDEAILALHARGLAPPTLRFYTWRPVAVSLGRHQDVREVVSIEDCQRLGIEVVRRPTGGWAVLHDGDLTFSIIASHALLGTGSVMAAYRQLASGIVAGLGNLGLTGTLVNRDGEDKGKSALCFAVKRGSDIAVGDAKLVGSAQVRRQRAVLQQNDLPLRPHDARCAAVFRDESAREALLRSSNLEGLLCRPVRIEEVKHAVVTGFEMALGATFETGNLSPEEQHLCAGCTGYNPVPPGGRHGGTGFQPVRSR